jgi:hypothetical protein
MNIRFYYICALLISMGQSVHSMDVVCTDFKTMSLRDKQNLLANAGMEIPVSLVDKLLAANTGSPNDFDINAPIDPTIKIPFYSWLGYPKNSPNKYKSEQTHFTEGETLLHLAMNKGCPIETAAFLLSKGARVDILDGDPVEDKDRPAWETWEGLTPLHAAVIAQEEEKVRLLVQHGKKTDPYYVDSYSGEKHPPLYYASKHESVAMIKLLLELGANINAHNGLRFTALHWARYHKNEQLEQFLLEKKANPNIPAPDEPDMPFWE